MCFSNAKKPSMTISLIETIQTGNTTLAEKLIENQQFGDIDEQTSKNNGTALFWASCLGYFDLVKLLIFYGANINATTAWNSTSLHAACDNNRVEVARYLIQCGADVKAKTMSHDSPLHIGAYRGFTLLCKILVEMGADTENRNNKNHTPIDNAVNQGYIETANYLRSVSKKGAGSKQQNSDADRTDPYRQIAFTTTVNQYPVLRRTASISQQNGSHPNRRRRTIVYPGDSDPILRRDNRTLPEQGMQRRSNSVYTRNFGTQCTLPVNSDSQNAVATQMPSMGTDRRPYSIDMTLSNDSFLFSSSLQNDLSVERKGSTSSDEWTFRNIPI